MRPPADRLKRENRIPDHIPHTAEDGRSGARHAVLARYLGIEKKPVPPVRRLRSEFIAVCRNFLDLRCIGTGRFAGVLKAPNRLLSIRNPAIKSGRDANFGPRLGRAPAGWRLIPGCARHP